jgi:hypothetical protein
LTFVDLCYCLFWETTVWVWGKKFSGILAQHIQRGVVRQGGVSDEALVARSPELCVTRVRKIFGSPKPKWWSPKKGKNSGQKKSTHVKISKLGSHGGGAVELDVCWSSPDRVFCPDMAPNLDHLWKRNRSNKVNTSQVPHPQLWSESHWGMGCGTRCVLVLFKWGLLPRYGTLGAPYMEKNSVNKSQHITSYKD